MSDRVLVFETTLRDGEQSAGCFLPKRQRIDIAVALDGLALDIIKAGFPVSSCPDFEAIQEASQKVQNATVAVMAPAPRNSNFARLGIDQVRQTSAHQCAVGDQ